MAEGRIVFRCDASPAMGAGHVMRCLTLADALAGNGRRCIFLCRALPGRLGAMVVERGHELRLLPGDGEGVFDADADARLCSDAMRGIDAAWLVVDHYGIDAGWERSLRPAGCRVLAIDDLADRPHDCDLLLDQNLGRRAADYDALLPAPCRRLVGPSFALLRPQFAARRAESLAGRAGRPMRHLLIAMGGTDGVNASEAVLDALAGLALPAGIRATVVLGSGAPWLERVRARAAEMRWPVAVETDVDGMAELMAGADLCIGAAGGSAWERCCLGLPSLLLVLADNQAASAAALDAEGAAVLLGDFRQESWRKRLADALARLSDADCRRAMVDAASRVADGRGAARVARAMLGAELTVRAATPGDAEAIWEWRHAGGASRFYRDPRPTPLAEHLAWFARALGDPRRLLLVVTGPSGPFAHVRLDRAAGSPAEAEVAVCLSQAARGRGLSVPALGLALEHAAASGVRRFTAVVHEDNAGSVKLFSALGFVQDGRDGPFLHFARDAAAGAGQGPGD